MKKDDKRLWKEMRAANAMYWACETAEKPRLYIRRLAAEYRLYAKRIADLEKEDTDMSDYFHKASKSLLSKISGARHMKKLMEEYHGN